MNLWLVVAGAVIIQLCLGAIYAWSAFTGAITKPLAAGGHYGFSATEAAWIFSAKHQSDWCGCIGRRGTSLFAKASRQLEFLALLR